MDDGNTTLDRARVDLLHSVAAAVQNGLYAHGIDPGTASCYSAAEAVLQRVGEPRAPR